MKRKANLLFRIAFVKLLLFFVLGNWQNTFAAFELESNGATNSALGKVRFTLPNQNWLPGNSFISAKQNGVAVSLRRKFGLAELDEGSLGVTYKKFGLNFALGGRFFGDEIYRETEILFGASYPILENLKISSTFRALSLKIENYGSSTSFALDFEALVSFGDFIFTNSFSNFTFSEVGKEKIPQVLVSSLFWKVSERIQTIFEFEKDVDFPLSLHFGTQVALVKGFYLRLGTQTEPEFYTGGFGVNFRRYSLDYSYSEHRELGGTNEFTLSVSF